MTPADYEQDTPIPAAAASSAGILSRVPRPLVIGNLLAALLLLSAIAGVHLDPLAWLRQVIAALALAVGAYIAFAKGDSIGEYAFASVLLLLAINTAFNGWDHGVGQVWTHGFQAGGAGK